jgi:hypothetical protein
VRDAVLEARVPKPLYEIGTFARLNLGAAISLERLCAYLKGALDELQNPGWRPLAQIQERLRCWMGEYATEA